MFLWLDSRLNKLCLCKRFCFTSSSKKLGAKNFLYFTHIFENCYEDFYFEMRKKVRTNSKRWHLSWNDLNFHAKNSVILTFRGKIPILLEYHKYFRFQTSLNSVKKIVPFHIEYYDFFLPTVKHRLRVLPCTSIDTAASLLRIFIVALANLKMGNHCKFSHMPHAATRTSPSWFSIQRWVHL